MAGSSCSLSGMDVKAVAVWPDLADPSLTHFAVPCSSCVMKDSILSLLMVPLGTHDSVVFVSLSMMRYVVCRSLTIPLCCLITANFQEIELVSLEFVVDLYFFSLPVPIGCHSRHEVPCFSQRESVSSSHLQSRTVAASWLSPR